MKKNILFVDDDENVINGIRRQLRPYREQWQLFFANTGNQALQAMQQNPIDLIVCDMLMPEMRGDKLLRQVSRLYPGTIRVILSGYADEETVKCAMEVAHQHLIKPCNAETLREAITQIFNIQACVKNPRIIDGIGDPNQLPSLPKIYRELNAAVADENTTVNDLADIFAQDMVLSAKLLHLVNSAYFGLHRHVSNLSDAINMIGIKKLNSLVLSVHLKTAFPVTDPTLQRYMEYFWKDAVRVAELAKLISLSEQQQEDRPDQAYLGGLLHNMGLLIFLSRGGHQLALLLEQVKHSRIPVSELETLIFGFTRSEAAAYILSLWKIPPRIIESILLQNTPSQADYDGVSALTAVHVAACLLKPAVMQECDRLFEIVLDTQYLQRINKQHRLADWQRLAEKVITQFDSTEK
ncbi:response regulator [Methylomonas methanica]|uniref:Response regulator receiver modulated metal dependent hydrolase n=1 Tax=Methylomonas methanica (strain DSM 25384 / MC09) TaxID=857087 RepID=G0A7G9_METMM|nr:response regulator [Methylomonas methanica]AEG00639.1 response regulator receiver modulated metal dependent hydrolase [Methylomonas methanica MC09]